MRTTVETELVVVRVGSRTVAVRSTTRCQQCERTSVIAVAKHINNWHNHIDMRCFININHNIVGCRTVVGYTFYGTRIHDIQCIGSSCQRTYSERTSRLGRGIVVDTIPTVGYSAHTCCRRRECKFCSRTNRTSRLTTDGNIARHRKNCYKFASTRITVKYFCSATRRCRNFVRSCNI